MPVVVGVTILDSVLVITVRGLLDGPWARLLTAGGGSVILLVGAQLVHSRATTANTTKADTSATS